MKKYIIIILSLLLLLSFSVSSFAANYSVYSSVTPSTSQISILINTLQNQPDLKPFLHWVAFRTGDYDYSLFYNIKDDGSALRLRYYATSSGYNTVWHLVKSSENNFSYYSNNYTVVGTDINTLGSDSYQQFVFRYILKISVPFILILFIFFIFRIKRRGREVRL